MADYAARLEIIRRLDVDAAIAMTPPQHRPPGGMRKDGKWCDQRATVLAGLHRARTVSGRFTKAERDESRAWLKANGWDIL